MNLARIGNKYLADTEPWKLAKTDMERVGTILNISLQPVSYTHLDVYKRQNIFTPAENNKPANTIFRNTYIIQSVFVLINRV